MGTYKVKRQRNSWQRWAEREVFKTLIAQLNQWQSNHVGDLLNSDVSINRIKTKELYLTIYNRVGHDFANQTHKELTGEGLKFYNERLRLKDQNVTVLDQIINGFIENELASRITNVTHTTQEIIRKSVVLAKKEGLGELEAAKLIREKFASFSKARSRTIARTEIIGSSNFGSLQGAKLTNLPLMKEWIASVGVGQDRADHTAYDGTLVPIDGFFNVGGERLEYPGDVNGSAGNIINCACTVGYKRI